MSLAEKYSGVSAVAAWRSVTYQDTMRQLASAVLTNRNRLHLKREELASTEAHQADSRAESRRIALHIDVLMAEAINHRRRE